MRQSWMKLVDRILRPARPLLARCLEEREAHLASRRLATAARARAIADCVARIELARAEVFAAKDGVVGSRMTDLEREWRTLSRQDPDRGVMDLWAKIAPPSWIDRKRWRDCEPDARLDAAVALAADADGVEAAEASVAAFREAIACGLGERVRWSPEARDADPTTELLLPVLDRAMERVAQRETAGAIVARAEALERDVHDALLGRLPERPLLAQSLGRAAFVDCILHASSLPNPVDPLRAFWSTGYVLSTADADVLTIEIPVSERRIGLSV